MVNQTAAETAEAEVENLAPGATFQSIADGKIFIFTLKNGSRVAVDAWANKIRALTRDLPSEKPFYIFNDFSDNNFSLTPYMRQQIKDLADWKPDQIGFICIALPRTFVNQLLTLFIPTIKRKNIATRMFLNRTQALDWLKGKLAKSG